MLAWGLALILQLGRIYAGRAKVVLRIGFMADSWVVTIKPRNLSLKQL